MKLTDVIILPLLFSIIGIGNILFTAVTFSKVNEGYETLERLKAGIQSEWKPKFFHITYDEQPAWLFKCRLSDIGNSTTHLRCSM